MKPYKFGRHGGGKWRKISLFLIIIGLVALTAGYFGLKSLYERNLLPVNPAATEDIVYTLESGTSVSQIADQLDGMKLIRSDRAFEQYVRSNDLTASLQAGTYRLRQSMSVTEIADILASGRIAADLFTILPGKRLDQIRASFLAEGFSQAEMDAVLQPDLYVSHPALAGKPAGASLEGYLFPDSYNYTKGQTAAQTIVRQALDRFAVELTEELKAGLAAQGLSVYQALTLASIVEEEAGYPADKPTIAQVFLTRLEIGMSLGSDVTSIYGAVIDGVDLPEDYATAAGVAIAHDSPYNTRMHAGLPPGPISNAGTNSLKAVADPSDTDYLFFVAGDPNSDGTPGKTYFSRTEAEHNEAVRKYCQVLC